MALQAIESKGEAQQAFQQWKRSMAVATEKYSPYVGYRGGGSEEVVLWNPRLEIWSVLSERKYEDQFWCAFGTSKPVPGKPLSIVCEINPPKNGIKRRCAGCFVKDANGNVYIAHSGRIGGGVPNVGKRAFIEWYSKPYWRDVRWSDGKQARRIVLGSLSAQRVSAYVAEFVRDVEDFKRGVSRPLVPATPKSAEFVPEFEGARRPYSILETITAQCDHGLVVNALASIFKARGGQVARDLRRDLTVKFHGSSKLSLFEVKIEACTANVYEAVGQLMINGNIAPQAAKRVAVLPRELAADYEDSLRVLGIHVLYFSWNGTAPEFVNIEQIVTELKK